MIYYCRQVNWCYLWIKNIYSIECWNIERKLCINEFSFATNSNVKNEEWTNSTVILASQIDLISTLNLFFLCAFQIRIPSSNLFVDRLSSAMNNFRYVIHKMLKSSKRTLLCINSPSQPILMFKEGLLLKHGVWILNPFEKESKLTSIDVIL